MNYQNVLKEKNFDLRNRNNDRFIKTHKEEFIYCIKNQEHKKILKKKFQNKNLNQFLRKQQIYQELGSKTLNYLTKKNMRINLLDRKSSSDSVFEPIKQIERKIPEKAFKILDAPGYKDDFYSQLLDWNNQDQIVLSVNNQIFIHKFDTKKTFKLHTDQIQINSLKSNDIQKVAFGTNQGCIMLYDQVSENCYKYQKIHNEKITTIDFVTQDVLLSGSTDKQITLFDLRCGQIQQKYNQHKGSVCRIVVNQQDNHKVLSGGADKTIFLYDLRSNNIVNKNKAHNSPIRALDWDQNNRFNFFSGGSCQDKTLKMWNSVNFQIKLQKVFDSQICDLTYVPLYNEIILGLGNQNNQIAIVKAHNFQQIAGLEGHHKRVIDLKLSKDQQKIVSASNDGSIRFWELNVQQNENCQKTKLWNSNKEQHIRQLYFYVYFYIKIFISQNQKHCLLFAKRQKIFFCIFSYIIDFFHIFREQCEIYHTYIFLYLRCQNKHFFFTYQSLSCLLYFSKSIFS